MAQMKKPQSKRQRTLSKTQKTVPAKKMAEDLRSAAPINKDRWNRIRGEKGMLSDYLNGVNTVAESMAKDPEMMVKFLESGDGVRLVAIYKAHRRAFTPVIGKLDETDNIDRIKMMLHSSELCFNASGVDGNIYRVKMDPLSSGSSSSPGSACGNCDTMTLGCCVVHFWGWNADTGLCC